MRVAALFRYPVKGFTREECDVLDVLPGGRIAGDRALGLRFNDTSTADDAWGTKPDFVALVHTPGLTPLDVAFDHETLRLRIRLAGDVLLDDIMDDAGRRRFASVIERYLLGLDEPDRVARGSFPLRVVGDGITPRYQDREPGYTTLHGRGESRRYWRARFPKRPTSPSAAFARTSRSTVSTRGTSSAGSVAACASAASNSTSSTR